MNRFRNALLTIAAAMLVAQALLFTGPGQALAKEVTDVLVTNTVANPVFVRNIDDGRQPVSLYSTIGIGNGENFSNDNIVTLPTDKRLIIESVSAVMELPQGQTPFKLAIDTVAGGKNHTYIIALSRQGTSTILQKDSYAATYALRLYPDPGSLVSIRAIRSDSTGITLGYVSISGYYVDVP